MSDIVVRFRDGNEKVFEDRGRADGSYSVRAVFEDGVVTIIDVWGGKTTYPLDLVASVERAAEPRGW